MEKFNFIVDKNGLESRVDIYLKEKVERFSRNQIQRWIKLGGVLCNGNKITPSTKLKEGDNISLSIPEEDIHLVPENIALDILYEDKSILILNKPAGIVTHPGAGNKNGTLANAVAHHLLGIRDSALFARTNRALSLIPTEGSLRLGIVHRLDKETSGVMVVAKNSIALTRLTESFKERSVKKVYRAIVCGSLELAKGEIEGSIGRAFRSTRMEIAPSGKYARTDFKVLKRFSQHSYLEAYPKTGRTHQIRLHLAKIGYPILGDKTYGLEPIAAPRQMLHAYSITFPHPSNKKLVTFTAPLPKDFKDILKSLESKEI